MSKKREYIGLDLETSGSTHEHHVPIQIGIAMPNEAVFRSDIGGWVFYDEDDHTQTADAHSILPWWSSEAYGIHNITKARLTLAPDKYDVDTMAAKFIGDHSKAWLGNRIMVGWNVGSFDAPFVRQHLPKTANSLSYRSLDLNAASFTTAEALGLSWSTLKTRSKDYAADQLGSGGWHDAGFDAQAALLSLDYIKQVIKHGDYM